MYMEKENPGLQPGAGCDLWLLAVSAENIVRDYRESKDERNSKVLRRKLKHSEKI